MKKILFIAAFGLLLIILTSLAKLPSAKAQTCLNTGDTCAVTADCCSGLFCNDQSQCASEVTPTPTSTPTPPPTCGNGILETGEQCDNGTQNGVACTSDYNYDFPNTCTYCNGSCQTVTVTGEYCGDGILNKDYEECDDGNKTNHDGCSRDCKIEYPIIFNKTVIGGTAKPDDWSFSIDSGFGGRTVNGGSVYLNLNFSHHVDEIGPSHYALTQASGSCQLDTTTNISPVLLSGTGPGTCDITNTYVPYCGDNMVNQTSEICDGNSQSCKTADGYSGSQSCNLTCDGWNTCQTQEYCGDGIKNGPEECDSGSQNGAACTASYKGYCYYCSNSCKTVTVRGPYCGDGIVNGNEQCDGAVGCSSTCTWQYGSISGFKYLDLNMNNKWDGWLKGEIKINNWVIFLDKNNNKKLDKGETTLVTSGTTGFLPNASYTFSNLLPGTYNVCEVQLSGLQTSLPNHSTCQTVTLAGGENKTGVNFGNYMSLGKK